MTNEWLNGFLFLGNWMAIDFLNTRPVIGNEIQEWLPDTAAMAKWMAAAELVRKADAEGLRREWEKSGKSAVAVFQSFREDLRRTVLAIEAGSYPKRAFVSQVNRLLVDYPLIEQVAKTESGYQVQRRFEPLTPFDLFAPLAQSVAKLIGEADYQRLRKCTSCELHFYDTSKKGARQWCSMSMCGNRAKVAAFAGRKRALNPAR